MNPAGNLNLLPPGYHCQLPVPFWMIKILMTLDGLLHSIVILDPVAKKSSIIGLLKFCAVGNKNMPLELAAV